ncbi:MAG: tRNA lysidine(34) synthetase TilS [Steroidobacteraceae bacterium]
MAASSAAELGVDPVAEISRLLGDQRPLQGGQAAMFGGVRRLRIAVAFSGGIDSTALLAALAAQRALLRSLRAVHVNHHLMPHANEWAVHCQRFARTLRVPIELLDAAVSTDAARSLEERAREARYRLLAGVLQRDEVLVIAQHADDQAETVLLQLLRGAGVAGLAAMPAVARLGTSYLVRPLLTVRREQIERYVRTRGFAWIDDESNTDPERSRNFLRHRVMPVLNEHWPGAVRTLSRSARHLAEAQQLLGERARADWALAADGAGLAVVRLRALSPARRKNLLRAWIVASGYRVPDSARLAEIAGPLLTARQDSQPEVAWSGALVRRAADRLELHRPAEPLAGARELTWNWEFGRPLALPDQRGSLIVQSDPLGPLDADRLPATLVVRPRQGGEMIRPAPRARRRAVKNLLQEAGLTSAQRFALPFLWHDGQLVAVGDRWSDASVQAWRGTRRRARLIWQG